MGIKKGLAIVGAGLALNAAAANAGNLNETKKDVQKNIEKNIQHTPSKPKASALDLTELFSKSMKNKEKIDEIIKKRKNINADITDIKVDEKLKYTTFKYKNKYNIKYEPKVKEGEPGMDVISIIDSTSKKEYQIQIGVSLFKKDLAPKNPKEEIHKQKVAERLEYIINIFNNIAEKTIDENMILNNDEAIVCKGSKIYFTAEKKIGAKEDFQDSFWRIDYTKAKTEGNIKIAEEYNFTEIEDPENYFNNATLEK